MAIKKLIQESVSTAIMVVLTLLALEGLCRVSGRPSGDFEAFFGEGHLYQPNQTLQMTWGPIPYLVETNGYGYRGEDFSREKPEGALRILTIGDSITDGFFVDNPSTWQPLVQSELTGRLGKRVEVINGARGGGSIDKQLAMLKASVPLVGPDLVILTFVSNDIAEILGTPRQQLLQRSPSRGPVPGRQRLQRFLMTRTGLGEFLFHAYLTLKSSSYRERTSHDDTRHADDRYEIAGGDDFIANAIDFRERFASTDGLVLGDAFDEATETSFDDYSAVLAEFVSVCRSANAELLLVYFPAYPQIYDDAAPRHISARLRSVGDDLGIDFLDLTVGFRAAGTDQVLHLAPVDFHLNPAGNRVFAQLVADHVALANLESNADETHPGTAPTE